MINTNSMKTIKIICAAAAAILALSAMTSCEKEYTGPFNFTIETPDNPSDRKMAHLLKDCVIGIAVIEGLTMPYDVTSELYIYDADNKEYVPAESTYDMPNGERMCLKRMWPCKLPDAPNGTYKAAVTLVRSTDGMTRSATKEFILNRNN